MDNRELAILTAKILDEKKARDLVVLDISEKSGFADYLVIATAGSQRQMTALKGELEDKLAEDGVIFRSVEGRGESGWILLDYGDMIVNIFTEEQREHYQLEKIWNDCPSIDIN